MPEPAAPAPVDVDVDAILICLPCRSTVSRQKVINRQE